MTPVSLSGSCQVTSSGPGGGFGPQVPLVLQPNETFWTILCSGQFGDDFFLF